MLVVSTLLLLIVVLNWTWGRLPAVPTPSGQFLQVGDLQLHYQDRSGDGQAVLLLHGLPGTAEDFERVMPLLTGHRVIAIDRPGFGHSTGGYLSFRQQLDVIHTLLTHLGLSHVIIAGHSYGGTIALGYAERFPEQIVGLVLVDAAAEGIQPSTIETAEAHLVRAQQLPVIRPIAHAMYSQLLRKIAAEQGAKQAFAPAPVAPDYLRHLLAITMSETNLDAYAGETLAAGDETVKVDRNLRTIQIPTIVIQGQSDHAVPLQVGQKLAADMGVSLITLSGGHMQTYEHPAQIAHAIDSLAENAGKYIPRR